MISLGDDRIPALGIKRAVLFTDVRLYEEVLLIKLKDSEMKYGLLVSRDLSLSFDIAINTRKVKIHQHYTNMHPLRTYF